MLAELCSLTFGDEVDPGFGRPLSNLEQVIAQGTHSVTVNEEMARLVRAYSEAAWAAGDDWADLAPAAIEDGAAAEPAAIDPVDCYFSPSDGRWLNFDLDAGEVTSFLEVGCDSDRLDYGPFVVAESVEAAEAAGCLSPSLFGDWLIPVAPAGWFGCGLAT